jgi:hypothetical protein
MEIKQEVNGLSHGLYAMQCRASTQHYCLSDQHGYLTDGSVTAVTPPLSADYFDLPILTADERWQKLTTTPIYVEDNSALTLGFVGSKQGAVDGAWVEYGNTSSTKQNDLREGWWCATDFVLLKMPLYRKTVTPDQWGVICLPYAVKASESMALYQVAGITADYTQLCLEPIAQSVAGMAFIYKSKQAQANFLEFGAEVTKTTEAPGNIRSYLSSSATTPQNYYYLQEGQWVKITDSDRNNRPKVGNYNGIMRPLTDGAAKPLTVYETWTGATMPIVGVTEAEITKNEANAEHVASGGGMKGDVNGDNSVDLADVVAVISFINKTGIVGQSQADVNGDGVVDIADITYILTLMTNK